MVISGKEREEDGVWWRMLLVAHDFEMLGKLVWKDESIERLNELILYWLLVFGDACTRLLLYQLTNTGTKETDSTNNHNNLLGTVKASSLVTIHSAHHKPKVDNPAHPSPSPSST